MHIYFRNYRARVDKTEKAFGIEGKVFQYTTDNEATMKLAFKKEERNGCFAHIESKSSKKCLERQKHMKTLRKKLRKVATKYNKSSKFKNTVTRMQKNKGLKDRTIKKEVATRFTATHTMFWSIMNDPNEKTNKSVDSEMVRANIECINVLLYP